MQKMETYRGRSFRPNQVLRTAVRESARLLKRNRAHQEAERRTALKLILVDLNTNRRDKGAFLAAGIGMRRGCAVIVVLMLRFRNKRLRLVPTAAAAFGDGFDFLLGLRYRGFVLRSDAVGFVRMMPAATQQHMQG